jgi:hypothetical protein
MWVEIVSRRWFSWSELETPRAISSYPETIKPLPERHLMSNPPVMFVLKCDHIVSSTIYSEKQFPCYECKGLQDVADVHVFEWRSVCHEKKCPASRWTGLSRRLAEHIANGHKRSKPTHNVGVEYARNPNSDRVRNRLLTNGLI